MPRDFQSLAMTQITTVLRAVIPRKGKFPLDAGISFILTKPKCLRKNVKNAAQKFQEGKRMFPCGIKIYRKTAKFFDAVRQEVPQNYCNFFIYAV